MIRTNVREAIEAAPHTVARASRPCRESLGACETRKTPVLRSVAGHRIKRIASWRNAIAGVAALFCGMQPFASKAADPAPTRPNILFILCDDHAYQAISAYGSILNKTPNIDRIAANGMRFDRCLTTYSLCGPARACILTGKYSHLNGFYNNMANSRFDGSQVTYPKLLQQAGYATAIVGKWHLNSDPTGFDFWEILPGQGRYYNPPMFRNGKKVTKHGYVTDIITDDALDWLKHRDPSKPFALTVAHKAPHRSWEPSIENLNLYDKTVFPEPPTLFDDYTGRGKAEHEQKQAIATTLNDEDLKFTDPVGIDAEQKKAWDAYYQPRNQAFHEANPQGADLLHWKYQRFMHDYMATVASVDQSVGKILDYLAATGQDKNTIIVYSSDQGVFLGEHGWMDKRWIFEQSLRTPLLVQWPEKVAPGTVSDAMVSNLDYAETFLDAAGITPPAEMQGRSMLPILEGHTPTDWRTDFYYHYYEHPAVHNVARQYGIVTNQYKLVYFYEPEMNYWELFDLKADPLELTSVYDKPEYARIQADLHKRLDKLRVDLKVPEKDPPASEVKKPNGD